MSVLVGTSGWSYDHWVDVLDPRKATSLERLDAYARGFRTVEVDNTFYNDGRRTKSSRPGASARPTASSPPSRRRGGSPSSASSNDPTPWLDRMEAGLARLGEKRGPLPFQLPFHFPRDLDRLDRFLGALPSGPRAAIEFRRPTWDVEETFALLERHGAAYCVTSGANLPCVLRATAPFVYVRFLGTAPTRTTSTPAPTPRTTSAGGPTASASGAPRAVTSTATSTTTATDTPSATPSDSANSSPNEPRSRPAS